MLDFPNSMKEVMLGRPKRLVDAAYFELSAAVASYGSNVRKTEKIPFFKAPTSFIDFIKRGPLFYYGEMNWRPKPIIPYLIGYIVLLNSKYVLT